MPLTASTRLKTGLVRSVASKLTGKSWPGGGAALESAGDAAPVAGVVGWFALPDWLGAVGVRVPDGPGPELGPTPGGVGVVAAGGVTVTAGGLTVAASGRAGGEATRAAPAMTIRVMMTPAARNRPGVVCAAWTRVDTAGMRAS